MGKTVYFIALLLCCLKDPAISQLRAEVWKSTAANNKDRRLEILEVVAGFGLDLLFVVDVRYGRDLIGREPYGVLHVPEPNLLEGQEVDVGGTRHTVILNADGSVMAYQRLELDLEPKLEPKLEGPVWDK